MFSRGQISDLGCHGANTADCQKEGQLAFYKNPNRIFDIHERVRAVLRNLSKLRFEANLIEGSQSS